MRPLSTPSFGEEIDLAGATHVGDRVMNIFKQLGRIWSQYREFRSTYSELSQLSDTDLKDMGLYRGDIVRIAYGEAENSVKLGKPANTQRDPKSTGTFGALRESH
jgi:uncharacterized protein YjiS (DUF1127 family)